METEHIQIGLEAYGHIRVLNSLYTSFSFGRAAVNPFGDDEDDIDVKQLLQSHFEVIL